MLRFEAKRFGNNLVIQRHVRDLMGNIISASYKELKNLDVFPLQTQAELERWFNESKAEEKYCTK